MNEGIPLPEEPDRVCIRCGVSKPATAFHRLVPGRRRAQCAECRAATRPSRPVQGRGSAEAPELRRRARLKSIYGITPEQYTQMLADQGGGCAICGREAWGVRPLAVDHCHESGRVRAILCMTCNRMLGSYEVFRERAEEFLAKYGRGNPLLGYDAD